MTISIDNVKSIKLYQRADFIEKLIKSGNYTNKHLFVFFRIAEALSLITAEINGISDPIEKPI